MRAIVCGSRRWDDCDAVEKALRDNGVRVVIHGGALGADLLADAVARKRGIPLVVYPALWPVFGKAAGPIRNQFMLEDSRPDIVLAFPLPGGKGTEDMIRRAKKAGVRVVVYGEESR